MTKQELQTELKLKSLEIEYLKQIIQSLQEQRNHLTEVLVTLFASKQG